LINKFNARGSGYEFSFTKKHKSHITCTLAVTHSTASSTEAYEFTLSVVANFMTTTYYFADGQVVVILPFTT